MQDCTSPSIAADALPEPVSFDDIFFDSTCLKADIHFPIDWVLLRDAARTLMKATTLIREHGLKNRMPQEPLEFLSDMNTLCMEMTAKGKSADGRKQRKKVLREMKALEKRIARHATLHLEALKTRRHESDLSEAQARQITGRMENVLDQLPAAMKQAHERMIGGRQVANDEKILSLYDDSINVIKRGKAGAAVEFGNKLWLGENRDEIIVDYKLYQDNPSDSALTKPALKRLVDDQKMDIKNVWGIAAWQASQTARCWSGVKSATACVREMYPSYLTSWPTNRAFAKDSKEEPAPRRGLASSGMCIVGVRC